MLIDGEIGPRQILESRLSNPGLRELARGDQLHPIQPAFIDVDAIQCGYCTPGFILSGAKLLEETERPTRQKIEQSISGNLCRCTGYVNSVRAIERAAARETCHG